MGVLVRWITLAVATVLLSTFAVLGIGTAAHAEGEGTILSLVNQARAANNLGPLKLNSSISSVANSWANQMAANGAMTHNPNYSSQIPSGWSRAAENVAHGYPSPGATHDAWMNSSGHRANILGDFTDIGIAFVTVGGSTWAVENFAKYGASVPPPAPPTPPAAPAPPPTVETAPPPAPSPSASSPSSQTGAGNSTQGASPRTGNGQSGPARVPDGGQAAQSDDAPVAQDRADGGLQDAAGAADPDSDGTDRPQPRIDRVSDGRVGSLPGDSAPVIISLGMLLAVGVLVAGPLVGMRLWRRWILYFR